LLLRGSLLPRMTIRKTPLRTEQDKRQNFRPVPPPHSSRQTLSTEMRPSRRAYGPPQGDETRHCEEHEVRRGNLISADVTPVLERALNDDTVSDPVPPPHSSRQTLSTGMRPSRRAYGPPQGDAEGGIDAGREITGAAQPSVGTAKSAHRTPPRGRGRGWGRQLYTRWHTANTASGNTTTVSQIFIYRESHFLN